MRWVDKTAVPVSRTKASFSAPNVVRTYVLDPYKMAKDNRTGVVKSDVQAVLDGDIDDFISERLAQRA